MAVKDQEDSDFEGSGDTGSGYGDSDNDYETGSGNRCRYVGDDEDYDSLGECLKKCKKYKKLSDWELCMVECRNYGVTKKTSIYLVPCTAKSNSM